MKVGCVELMIAGLIGDCIKKKAVFTGAIELALATSYRVLPLKLETESLLNETAADSVDSNEQNVLVYCESDRASMSSMNSLDQVILDGLRVAQNLERKNCSDVSSIVGVGYKTVPAEIFEDAHVSSSEKELSLAYSILNKALTRYSLREALPSISKASQPFVWRDLEFGELWREFAALKASQPLTWKFQGFDAQKFMGLIERNSFVVPIATASELEQNEAPSQKVAGSPCTLRSADPPSPPRQIFLSPNLVKQPKLGIKTPSVDDSSKTIFRQECELAVSLNDRPRSARNVISPTTPLTIDGITLRHFAN